MVTKEPWVGAVQPPSMDLTFGIHSYKTLLNPVNLLKPNWKPSSSYSISAPTNNINAQLLLQSFKKNICVCVCLHIIPDVTCQFWFGRTVLYVCIRFLFMNDFLLGSLFAVVVNKCFMIGVNVWWVYLTPQNIPRAVSVLTLGNKVVLYRILYNLG